MNEEKIRTKLRTNIFSDIFNERQRQIMKWGYQRLSPLEFSPILGEEVGEVMKEIVEYQYMKKPLDNYRLELIQVAAVCLQMIEEYDYSKLNVDGRNEL